MAQAPWISALANHLWQSTVFVLAAWVLAFALRKNQARIRYWIWLVASLKFFLPFSLLIAAGQRVASTLARPVARPALSHAIEQIAQPFQVGSTTVHTAPAIVAHNTTLIPIVLLSLWATGSLALALSWLHKWWHLRAAVGAASFRTLETGVPVLFSSSLLEPGVFGIVQPVLLFPEGIANRLTQTQFDAILAHEMCHIRRRDNLTFALHMVVETIIWFHPLVWWIRNRLIEEREHACDEAVLQSGNEAEVYAESILNVCKFYIESPLACVSGVTGADLKKRIVRIMTKHTVRNLGFRKKLLLSVAGCTAVALPIVFGVVHSAQSFAQSQGTDQAEALPSFEVVSIKPSTSDTGMFMSRITPDGIHATNTPLMMIVRQAYGLFTSNDDQIVGAPAWFKTDRFDIDAKVSEADVPKLAKLTPVQRNAMLQQILVERFKFAAHRETRERPIYALVLDKNGSKLKEASPVDSQPGGPEDGPKPRGAGMMRFGPGEIEGKSIPISNLQGVLTQVTGRTVLDRTGLTGKYDISVRWSADDRQASLPSADGANKESSQEPSGPSIFTAIQEQLGLKLESAKGPVDGLVIDHVEKPSAN